MKKRARGRRNNRRQSPTYPTKAQTAKSPAPQTPAIAAEATPVTSVAGAVAEQG